MQTAGRRCCAASGLLAIIAYSGFERNRDDGKGTCRSAPDKAERQNFPLTSRRPCYASNALSFFVAVGNLPRLAFITSSARVKYRSPKVPVILECKPVASRPA